MSFIHVTMHIYLHLISYYVHNSNDKINVVSPASVIYCL